MPGIAVINKILAIGTTRLSDEEQKNRVQLVNLLCVVGGSVIFSIGGVLSYYLHWSLFVVVPLSVEFVLNASVLLWNHKQKFTVAAWLLYLLQCVMIAYLGIVLGRLLQLELVIILLIAIVYLIFSTKKSRLLAVATALLDLVILEIVYYNNQNIPSRIPVSTNVAFLIHALVLLAVIGIILLVSAPYVKSHDTNAELKRANHFIKIFVAQVTHELRTPLDSIHHVTQLLRGEISRDQSLKKIQPLVDIGWTVSSTARNIVNNVLTMAEIEAGKNSTVVNEAFKVIPYFEKISEVHRIMADREKMSLELIIDEGMPDVVYSDPLSINQIVTNLMANAFKYGDKGGRVLLEIKRQGYAWQIIILNTGPGIPPEKIDSIFDPFVTGRTGQGSGLGLFIVKNKLASLGGSIHVISNPGRETIFTVTLPLREGQLRDLPDAAGVDADTIDLQKLSVWVAEDDKLTAFLYPRFLKDMGCTYTIVANGQLLLELAQKKCPGDCPDIIILDCHMPELGGEEAIIRLKALPATSHIPIIVTTGDIYSDKVGRMLAAGAKTYIKKPIDHLALKKTIMLYLNKLPQN